LTVGILHRHDWQLLIVQIVNWSVVCNLSGIFHQVCYTAAGTVVGGAVFGPLGAAVGGAVGKDYC